MVLLKGSCMTFLVGAIMGGVIMSTVTLLFWSVSPMYDTPVAYGPSNDRSPGSISRLEVRRDVEMRAPSSEGCGCSQSQSDRVVHKLFKTESFQVSRDEGSSEHAQMVGKTGRKSDRVKRKSPTSVAAGTARKQELLTALGKGHSLRDTMMVGVVTTGSQLEWAESVSETWGHEVSQLVFYRGAKCNVTSLQARALGLQLVELPPSPSTGIVATRLVILHHMAQHFVNSHLWFLVVPGNTYVHIRSVEQALGRMDPHLPLILGPSANCLSGSGGGGALLVSQGLLKLLVPRLQTCVKSVGKHTELEGCLGETAKNHCVATSEFSKYFVEAAEGALTSSVLKSNAAMFSSLLTYGPLHQPTDMYVLHHHYKRTQLELLLTKTRALEQEVKEVCSSLGDAFFSPSSDQDCSLTLCSCQGPPSMAQCPPSGIVSNISPEFEPRSIYDYYPWEYFDTKTIYLDLSAQPSFKLKLKRNLKVELQQALTRAIQKSSEAYGQPLKFKRLVNGWVRHNPFVGNEYIIDYLLIDNKKKWVPQRVNLVRPLAKNYISVHDKYDTRTSVHFIVPLSRVTDRFKEFMSMYEVLVLAAEQNAELLLCVYGENDIKEVKDVIATYRKRYPDMRVKVLEGRSSFSRARALDLGFSSLQSHDLAFVCDVDMAITRAFLDRCRSNTVEGKRVYYPEFFKLYNMDYVYWNRSKPRQLRLIREHGHWAYYSFGMLCIYKSDYQKVGGFDTNIVGWGGEDVTFFQKIVRNRIAIMRSPDVGMSHRWHPKECAKTLSHRQYKHCLSSQEENLADRRELARYVYEQGPLKTAAGSHAHATPPHPMTETTTHTTPNRATQSRQGDADYKI